KNIENVAVGKEATMSSVLRAFQPPCLAVNGDTGTEWNLEPPNCVHSAQYDYSAWWEVDLGRDYIVQRITVFRHEFGRKRLADLQVTLDDQLCYSFPSHTQMEQLNTLPEEIHILCESPLIGRFLKIAKVGTANNSYYDVIDFCEVQVWGCSEGFYGPFCTRTCPQCPTGTTCSKVTGQCEPKCPDGYYGNGCSKSCGHCRDVRPCHKTTGECRNGCEEGWTGSRCDDVFTPTSSLSPITFSTADASVFTDTFSTITPSVASFSETFLTGTHTTGVTLVTDTVKTEDPSADIIFTVTSFTETIIPHTPVTTPPTYTHFTVTFPTGTVLTHTISTAVSSAIPCPLTTIITNCVETVTIIPPFSSAIRTASDTCQSITSSTTQIITNTIPTITPTGAITLPTVTPTETITVPTVTPTDTITVPTVTPTDTITVPTVTPTETITVPTVTPTDTITVPTVTPTETITVPTVTPTETITVPTVTPTDTDWHCFHSYDFLLLCHLPSHSHTHRHHNTSHSHTHRHHNSSDSHTH
ncbi:hypothetical protein BaRGS_00005397, partial [Batillaria attramentaria]